VTSETIVPPPVEPPAEPPSDGADATTAKSKLPSGARVFFDWMVVVAVALLVAFLVRTFVIAHFVVEGESMYSTLDTNDRVFVNKLSYRLHDPNRGDVVVLHQVTGASERGSSSTVGSSTSRTSTPRWSPPPTAVATTHSRARSPTTTCS